MQWFVQRLCDLVKGQFAVDLHDDHFTLIGFQRVDLLADDLACLIGQGRSLGGRLIVKDRLGQFGGVPSAAKLIASGIADGREYIGHREQLSRPAHPGEGIVDGVLGLHGVTGDRHGQAEEPLAVLPVYGFKRLVESGVIHDALNDTNAGGRCIYAQSRGGKRESE